MQDSREAQLAEIRRFLRTRHETNRAEQHKRFSEAWKDFERIVEMIVETYHPKRIYQWGSLLNANHFAAYSDIDIALEGITDAQTFFALLGDADALTRFPIDVVQLEKIHPLHAESIRKKGRLVYERP